MRPFLIFSVLIMCGSCVVFAQSNTFTLPNIIQPSPNASALGRYGEIPVSLSTGVPNISVPLHEIHSSQLSQPISISYHGSGIKVTDRASTAGLGWSLLAGGAITRVVQGTYDEELNGFYNLIFPDDNDPLRSQKEMCIGTGMTANFNQVPNTWDGQPDYFYYNFNGKSGKFLLKNRIVAGLDPEIVTIPYSPIKVKLIDVSGNTYPKWAQIEITDVDGTVYIFGTSMINEDAREMTSVQNGGNNVNNSPHPTTWYLTEIISADQSDVIHLKYTAPYSTWTINSYTYLNESWSLWSGLSQSTTYVNGNVNNSFTDTRNLSEIQFNNGKVTFDYTDFMDPSVKRLTTMHVFASDGSAYKEIRRYDFQHSAFSNSSPQNSLRLDGLIESGFLNGVMSSKPPYKFYYYKNGTKEVPPYNSKSQDLWGYYNGKNNSNLIMVTLPQSGSSYGPITSVANKRKAEEDYLKVGSLTRIEYPTGGSTDFEFEANKVPRTYTKYDTAFNTIQAHISNLLDGPTVFFSVTSDLITKTHVRPLGQPSEAYNAKLTFTLDDSGCTSNCNVSYSFQYILQDLTTNTTTNQYIINNPSAETGTVAYVMLITGHSYKLYFPNPGTGNIKYIMNAMLSAQYANYVVTTSQVTETVLTGGLRIKKITSIGDNLLIKTYNYSKAYFNSELFDGDFDKLALNTFFNDTWTKSGGYSGLSVRTYSENVTTPIGSVNNSAGSYEEVEEFQLDVDSNVLGKTVYTFNKALDEVALFMPYYRSDNSHIRDQLNMKAIYKYQSGVYSKQYEEVNTYTDYSSNPSIWTSGVDKIKFYVAAMVFNDDLTNIGAIEPNAYGCIGCLSTVGNMSILRMASFYHIPFKSVLTSNVKSYYNNEGPITTTTTYEYQNTIHLLPTRITSVSSDGANNSKEIIYPLDQNPSACLNNCRQPLLDDIAAKKLICSQCQTVALNNFVLSQGQRNSAGFILDTQAVLDANDQYINCQTSFNTDIQQSFLNMTNCLTAYDNCIESYYNFATEDNKAIIDLRKKSIITPVLEERNYKSNQLLSTTITKYKSFSSTNTAISKVQFASGSHALEDRLEYLNYNDAGKVTEQRKSGDVTDSYIWDFNSAYPVAMVHNASASNIAYTGFDADGNGTWSISSTTRDAVNYLFGTQSYALSNGAISKLGLNPSTTYTITFWVYGTGYIQVNGQTPTVTANVKNGWSYCMIDITNATSIVITGTRSIDELKLYPKHAQITTYTFEPGIGMRTTTDANNITTYYEYDAFGRLQYIRDDKGNIVKTHTYHYKQ